jgi:hypothetical protein
MEAGPSPERHPLRTVGLVVGALALVVVAAAVVLALWFRAYAPLSATGSGSFAAGHGLAVQPTFGSGGKAVFTPTYRKGRAFDTAFTLTNTGRFAVTVLGLPASQPNAEGLTAQDLFASDFPTASADPAHLHPLGSLRLEPHDTAIVDVRWRLDCGSNNAGEIASDRIRLRYRYLSMFTRTQSVELPFAVTLRCVGGPLSSP